MCKERDSFALKNFERFKKEHPDMIGKGCCDDCKHMIDKSDPCSGPPINRDDLCEPGNEQYKSQPDKPNIGNFKVESYDPESGKSFEEWLMEG